MLWSPYKVALAGIIVWFLIWVSAPIVAVTALDAGAMSYIGICYVAFFVGCFLPSLSRDRIGNALEETDVWDQTFNPMFFWVTMLLGLAGTLLRVIDRSVVRGVDYSGTTLQIRESLEQASATPLSAAASLIVPFSYLPFIMLMASRWEPPKRLWLLVLSLIVFSLPMIESFLQGSRSIMLLTAMMGYSAVICLRFRGSPWQPRIFIAGVAGILILSTVSTAIFSSRLQDFGRNLQESLSQSAYVENIKPNEEAREGLLSPEPFVRQYYEIVLPNALYYVSGAYEFTLLWTRPDPQSFSYGTNFTYPYTRVAAMVLDIDLIGLRDEKLFYRLGVFTTLFGPLWVEWGYFGIVMMAIFGWFMTVIGNYARSGYVNAMPLYLYMLTIIFYAPVVNFMTNGYGFYTINAFLLFFVFTSFTRGGVIKGDDPLAAEA